MFAVLNVGEIRNKVKMETPDGRDLHVVHKHQENDPSHSGIYNMKPDNISIAELILETEYEVYPGKS
jgi:hypothetical protein